MIESVDLLKYILLLSEWAKLGRTLARAFTNCRDYSRPPQLRGLMVLEGGSKKSSEWLP
jgi:hypothetical protein